MVDDEKDFLEPVAYWLRSKGYEVGVSPNGAAALDEIQKRRPDIIFMDINMPEMDGIQALEKIRQTDKELPVILLTAAFGDEAKIVKAKALGVSGFFAKNYTFEQLVQLLQVTLKTHQSLHGPSKNRQEP